MTVEIVYFVHDLTDPAVHRRVQMLAAGGATVKPIGFRRNLVAPERIGGFLAIDLGRTMDGRLAKRITSVLTTMANMRAIAPHVHGADVILARNLEMLSLGALARRRYATHASLIYESLDIHSLMLNGGPGGTVLRSIESRLWRDVDLLLTSSPAFVSNYFRPRGYRGVIRIEQNKVPSLENDLPPMPRRPPPGPPWRIGWFGMLRCRRSLEVLGKLAIECDGALEIIIRGRPSSSVFSDFATAIAGLPHVKFLGPYRNPTDLGRIYGEVHFSWTIDYYESGLNSTWLLPCRLYEGSLYGSVPIAQKGVETSKWLDERNAGVVLNEPIERALGAFFKNLTQSKYEALANGIAELDRQDLIIDQTGCRALVDSICHLAQASNI